MLQMLILQERTNTQLFSSGVQPCCDGDSGFPNCRVICMRKVTCIVANEQSVFGRLLTMDCQKTRVGALRYCDCLDGLNQSPS